MKLFFRHSHDLRLPWWAGVCWREWSRQGEIIAGPIPLNLIVRVAYSFWIWLKRPIRYFDAAHEAHYWRRVRRRQDLRTHRLNCPHCGMTHIVDMTETE